MIDKTETAQLPDLSSASYVFDDLGIQAADPLFIFIIIVFSTLLAALTITMFVKLKKRHPYHIFLHAIIVSVFYLYSPTMQKGLAHLIINFLNPKNMHSSIMIWPPFSWVPWVVGLFAATIYWWFAREKKRNGQANCGKQEDQAEK